MHLLRPQGYCSHFVQIAAVWPPHSLQIAPFASILLEFDANLDLILWPIDANWCSLMLIDAKPLFSMRSCRNLPALIGGVGVHGSDFFHFFQPSKIF